MLGGRKSTFSSSLWAPQSDAAAALGLRVAPCMHVRTARMLIHVGPRLVPNFFGARSDDGGYYQVWRSCERGVAGQIGSSPPPSLFPCIFPSFFSVADVNMKRDEVFVQWGGIQKSLNQ